MGHPRESELPPVSARSDLRRHGTPRRSGGQGNADSVDSQRKNRSGCSSSASVGIAGPGPPGQVRLRSRPHSHDSRPKASTGTEPGQDRAHCHQRHRVHDRQGRERGWPEAARPTVQTVAAPHARQQTMMPCGSRCNANDARRCVAAARLACAARQSATTATEIVNEQLAPD